MYELHEKIPNNCSNSANLRKIENNDSKEWGKTNHQKKDIWEIEIKINQYLINKNYNEWNFKNQQHQQQN
jgi:hypothetical protein